MDRCFCARCTPTDFPVVCSRCGEEVRWGTRVGHTGYLHRASDGDHWAVIGHTMTAAEAAEIERQLDAVRHRTITKTREVDGEKIVETLEEDYVARELDLIRYRKSKKFRAMEEAEADGEGDDEEVVPLPPVEVAQHAMTVGDFPPRSGIRQVVNLVLGADGWVLHRLTGSRGPYTGARGAMLSMSDMVIMQAVGPRGLDGTRPVAVASWRDGKFDTAYTGLVRDGQWTTTRANATDLKNWIKSEH